MKNKIKRLWVFTATDKNGNEGILAAPIGPQGQVLQMITDDADNLERLKKYAGELQLRNPSNKIKLVSFHGRIEHN